MTDKELAEVRESLGQEQFLGDRALLSVRQCRRLLAHIDGLESVLTDLLGEDGPRLLREQGVAEERARVVATVESRMQYFVGPSSPFDRDIANLIVAVHQGILCEIAKLPTADLLPPLALAEAERKVATLRAAMGRIATGLEYDDVQVGVPERRTMQDIARKALEETT